MLQASREVLCMASPLLKDLLCSTHTTSIQVRGGVVIALSMAMLLLDGGGYHKGSIGGVT
jgi:hypothetical protein